MKRRKSKKHSKRRKSKRKVDSGGCTSKVSIASNVEIITNDIINVNEFNNRTDLENVILRNIEIIEDGAFSYCDNLENIIFSDSLTSIGNNVFENTGLRCVTIPQNVKTIGKYVFAHCKNLENIEISGNNIDKISDGLFYDCKNLKNVTLPDSIRIIEQFAFYNCFNLKSITMPGNLKIIGKNAFLDCKSLKSVIFKRDDVLIEIEAKAFKNCTELSEFIFPSSLSKIGKDAFYGCEKITIPSPKGYLRIGDYSIKKLSGPTSIVILKPKKSINELPTMILFGDDHGKANPCEPCKNEKGCFNIYDNNFVNILNSVSSSTHLVELYLEMYNDVIPEMSSYIYDLHDVVKDCYRVKNTERYKNCKYKNMRFHYSDPRVPYIEGEKKYIEMMRPSNEKTKFMHYSDDFERCFDEFIDKINNYKVGMNEFVKNIFITFKNHERNSLIYKQIESNVYDFEYWSQIYLNIILNSENLILNIQNYIDKNEKQFYNKIKTYIFAPILDIYFLSRNFKLKDNIKKPSLIFAYFGKGHITNITRALTEYMDLYEIFYEKDVKGRCIEFDTFVNIEF